MSGNNKVADEAQPLLGSEASPSPGRVESATASLQEVVPLNKVKSNAAIRNFVGLGLYLCAILVLVWVTERSWRKTENLIPPDDLEELESLKQLLHNSYENLTCTAKAFAFSEAILLPLSLLNFFFAKPYKDHKKDIIASAVNAGYSTIQITAGLIAALYIGSSLKKATEAYDLDEVRNFTEQMCYILWGIGGLAVGKMAHLVVDIVLTYRAQEVAAIPATPMWEGILRAMPARGADDESVRSALSNSGLQDQRASLRQ
jgi:hypothetical protein